MAGSRDFIFLDLIFFFNFCAEKFFCRHYLRPFRFFLYVFCILLCYFVECLIAISRGDSANVAHWEYSNGALLCFFFNTFYLGIHL